MFKTAKQLKRQYQCITFHFLESLIQNQEFSGYQFYLTTSVMQTVSFNWFLSQWQKSEKCIFSKSKMSSAFFYFRIYGPYHKQNAYTLGPTNYQFVWHCGTNGEFFGLLNEFSACWNKSLKSQKQKSYDDSSHLRSKTHCYVCAIFLQHCLSIKTNTAWHPAGRIPKPYRKVLVRTFKVVRLFQKELLA